MGSGYVGCYADVVEESFIEKIVPKEWERFESLFLESDASVPHLIDLFSDYECKESNGDDLLKEAYESLVEAFQKKTGLTISIRYHDSSNDGDRYDEVNEWFWEVEGVWKRTSAGEKHKEYITRVTWVTFG